jgi:hypothetical protein
MKENRGNGKGENQREEVDGTFVGGDFAPEKRWTNV